MAEVNQQNYVNGRNRNSQKTARICEYMTYSGREAFKRLRTNVIISLGDKARGKNNVIGITSAQPSEGKSTVAINLAYSLAEQEKSVILLDCDLRRPSIHANIGIQQSPGMTEVLKGKETLSNVVKRYKSTVNDVCFDVVVAGELPNNPSEVLGSVYFNRLLDVVGEAYDVVILDLPPVNAVVDAAEVSGVTDGLVVVIRENHCTRYVLKDCMEQLQYAKANILGFVLNGSVGGSKRYQYGGAYRYDNAYYQYGK